MARSLLVKQTADPTNREHSHGGYRNLQLGETDNASGKPSIGFANRYQLLCAERSVTRLAIASPPPRQ